MPTSAFVAASKPRRGWLIPSRICVGVAILRVAKSLKSNATGRLQRRFNKLGDFDDDGGCVTTAGRVTTTTGRVTTTAGRVEFAPCDDPAAGLDGPPDHRCLHDARRLLPFRFASWTDLGGRLKKVA